jgi:hypothetical protein
VWRGRGSLPELSCCSRASQPSRRPSREALRRGNWTGNLSRYLGPQLLGLPSARLAPRLVLQDTPCRLGPTHGSRLGGRRPLEDSPVSILRHPSFHKLLLPSLCCFVSDTATHKTHVAEQTHAAPRAAGHFPLGPAVLSVYTTMPNRARPGAAEELPRAVFRVLSPPRFSKPNNCAGPCLVCMHLKFRCPSTSLRQLHIALHIHCAAGLFSWLGSQLTC